MHSVKFAVGADSYRHQYFAAPAFDPADAFAHVAYRIDRRMNFPCWQTLEDVSYQAQRFDHLGETHFGARQHVAATIRRHIDVELIIRGLRKLNPGIPRLRAGASG